eukprot:4435062-Prymnesium_polylepis.1
MGCAGEEDAPSRENIKSRLQKFRQQALKPQNPSPPPAASSPAAPLVDGVIGTAGGSGVPLVGVPAATEGPRAAELLEQQQVGLLAQLELQAKIGQQQAAQRGAQQELAARMHASRARVLTRPQLQRLAQHVL